MSDFAKNAGRRYPSHARKRSPSVTEETLEAFDAMMRRRGYETRSAAVSAVAQAAHDHGLIRSGPRDKRVSVTIDEEVCQRLDESGIRDENALSEAMELAVALDRLDVLDALLGKSGGA